MIKPAIVLVMIVFASTVCSARIQVGHIGTNEATAEIQIIRNGGFESSLSDWESIGKASDGYIAVSTTIVHSGSRALVLALYPPLGGTSEGISIVRAVSQTVSVMNLRNLTVNAWYQTRIDTSQAYAGLVVTVGGLTVNYAGASSTSWGRLVANPGVDIKTKYGVAAWETVFQSSDPVDVTIVLELLGQTPFGDTQFAFWDDVQANASIPVQTIHLFSSSTNLQTTETGSSSSNSSLLVTSVVPQTSAQYGYNASEQATSTMPFMTGTQQTLASAAILAAFIIIAAFLWRSRRKPESIDKTDEDDN
jgi:hypothetical protein